MNKKNPFLVLGINPDVIKNLNDKQIEEIIKLHYHVLQKIHHPDVGGDPERAGEINEAYSVIGPNKKDEELYDFLKKEFLEKKVSQIKKEYLDTEYKNLIDEEKKYLNKLKNFLNMSYFKDLLFPQKKEINVMNFKNEIYISMHDIAASIFKEYLIKAFPHLKKELDDSFKNFKESPNTYYMKTENKGVIRYLRKITEGFNPLFDPENRRKKFTDYESLKYIQDKINSKKTIILKKSTYFVSEIVKNKYLVGCIGDLNIDKVIGLIKREDESFETKTTRNLLETKKSFKEKNIKNSEGYKGLKRIAADRFMNIACYLKPTLEKGDFLFSVKKEDNNIYFELEGRIVAVNSKKKSIDSFFKKYFSNEDLDE